MRYTYMQRYFGKHAKSPKQQHLADIESQLYRLSQKLSLEDWREMRDSQYWENRDSIVEEDYEYKIDYEIELKQMMFSTMTEYLR